MRLTDQQIIKAIENKEIQITPKISKQKITGVSLDISLGNEFRTFNVHKAPFLDLSGDSKEISASIDKVMSKTVYINDDQRFFLHPGELALSSTFEKITLGYNILGWLDGRSSLARLGLMVHVTAHRIDPGWSGNIVLEFFNSGKLPLALKPKMKIGALNFERLSAKVSTPYNLKKDAKYRNQTGATASKIAKD